MTNPNILLAFELGYKACEDHKTLQCGLLDLQKLLSLPELPGLPRDDPRFTKLDQQRMLGAAIEEGSDLDIQEIAKLVMDSWDLCSCVAACTDMMAIPLAELLQRIDNKDEEAYITGEFLREHEEEDKEYSRLLDFAQRMGLIDEAEEAITPLGREYMESLI